MDKSVCSLLDLNILSKKASESERGRANLNLHRSYTESVQRFFNAIEPFSYIRPHRHLQSGQDELLLAIRGDMCAVFFDDYGVITDYHRLQPVTNGLIDRNVAIEILPEQWHMVFSFEPQSLLFEVKAGPFDERFAKEFAPWAPCENTLEADAFLSDIVEQASKLFFL